MTSTRVGSSVRRVSSLFASALIFLAPSASAYGASSEPRGLYLRNGTVMREGRPYASIGGNYDTLFGRLLQNKDSTESLDNLRRLAAEGIPFVRFRACGFWPKNWQLYLDDRPEYFRRMDKVVLAAEESHIGLIPSLFWKLATIPKLVGEPQSRLADPASKSIAFIKNYTREMVSRYKDSPAIWAWEFGNEANLGVDIPSRRRGFFHGSVFTDVGAGESEGVKLSTAQLAAVYATFGETVRSLDQTRIIDSGTTIPRPSAWHNARGEFWRRDNREQSYAALLQQNPTPMDVLSVHIYQKRQKLSPYGAETISQFIDRYQQLAATTGKPLFIGEFPTRDRTQAKEYLDAIVEHRVPLSAFWVFDNPAQEKNMNVSFDNHRAFAIGLIAEANKELQASGSR